MSQVRNELLPARSVVASLLLGTHPPELPVRQLIQTGQLLGASEGALRTAVSRMLAAGELSGGDARYRLAGHLVDRQRRQDAGLAPATQTWNGAWRVAVVTGEARPAGERAALRTALRHELLAELREGVWVRPDNLRVALLPGCAWMTARFDDPPAVADLWDLAGWSSDAHDILRSLEPIVARLDAGDASALRQAFVTGAALLRHIQVDPLLPPQLEPPNWPGAPARDLYTRFRRAFTNALVTHSGE